MPRKKVLFLIGSPNQTTQMHQIAELLRDEFDPFFSQLYYDGWQRPFYRFLIWSNVLKGTIVTGNIQAKADRYLAAHGLPNDFEARVYGHQYDLIVCCSDIIAPWNLLAKTKSVFVQEGMTDPLNRWARIVKRFTRYPVLTISTALNGMNNCCDVYCVASAGYAEHFRQVGVDAGKLVVTGIPNFDDIEKLRHNSFPHRSYVLVATTDMRETYRPDNRKRFIGEATRIAAGRPMFFKFHPNENMARATAEVLRWAPAGTRIFAEGNTEEMIANCAELITQYSTVAFVGLALGIPVHSYFDVEDLKRKLPWQNHGTSARRIADVCRRYASFAGSGPAFLKQYQPEGFAAPTAGAPTATGAPSATPAVAQPQPARS
ncbi:hypothetical protein [Hymenobacter coccineus]|uniref:UDP-N-acetyl glucosamine 2-epimerase n=1 Tax=Hymenobacter coccineus TaxID=1908235 RepID=A0A1G1TM31_9BACT|nr:hypothetical protein [Hymenobacter coccineus]OGX91938.1 hypothetical protein BEN49_03880 [Hymenobacter coccineus]